MKKIILVIGLLGFLVLPFGNQAQDNNFEIAKNIDIFTTLYRELHKNYVDEIQSGELMEEAIDAMLESLDPYTTYIPEAEVEDYKFMTTGQYGGIGAIIHKKDDHVVISELYEGFPAHKYGLLAGDKILEIDGQSIKGKSTEAVSNILKGQPGSTLSITVEREMTEEPLTVEVVRENVKVDNIPYSGMLKNNIGYIKLNGFTKDAWKEVKKNLVKLQEENELNGLIIDLRGNGGGLLRESVNIANLFVEKGEQIVSTKGRLPDKSRSYKTQFAPIAPDLPLAIIVNNRSASASEILAGSMQDLDRAVVIGGKTFGKGLVQNVIPLSYNSKAKITIAKYYIPSGRCIQSVDYFHKDDNGESHRIPDSLIHQFETKSGRTVYDGGGIEPDIKTHPDKIANITKSLYINYLIFDFATKFQSEHKSIAPPEVFEITDEIYNDFIAFISDKDYDYTTETEKALKQLRENAEKEKYFESIQDELSEMENKLIEDKNNDLQEFSDEIKLLLEVEIVTRYYFQEGKIKASLEEDPEVEKAIELLADQPAYHNVLKTDIADAN
ncbi:MAG: S41 family peptidase [Bacteroidales bacterium]|nr:S41 family peptidase [Bacteroidales bacterium]MCF8344168.1 S41 family peptidase [Bacteroidales bacterium]MCF8351123.1 S41 family peptidase [Bacteroidales bacterium]MCF8374815.1 S41 family peptidase [Bacteroidales bacterium]MCF8399781.1 S41 family peptidase [Bacteroidales bacterium]